MATTKATGLAGILDPDDLKALVKAYNDKPEALADLGASVIESQLPRAANAVNALTNYFFTKNTDDEFPMSEKSRERGIISVLVATDIDAGWVIAVHFYWAIAVGLSPEAIANMILLASTYSGIPHWTVNIQKFTTILQLLKKRIVAKDSLNPVDVAKAIINQYQYESIDDIKAQLGKFGRSITDKLLTLEQPAGSNGKEKRG
jgi:alkylhydroperoxidase/carboxymuconolactone decarboxylase family protein YurZ